MPEPALFPASWPFFIYNVRDLDPVLLVCRRWREVALSTPSLWSDMNEDDFVGDGVFERSASAPLSIHDHYDRSPPPLIWERSSLHASRLQALHTHSGLLIEGSRPENLEHCKLSGYHAGPFLPKLFCGDDNRKLRSLYLDRVNFLPFNHFPALTLFSFSLCQSWSSQGGLVRFLTGSPKLKELYICRVDVVMHAQLAANEPTRWQSVALPELQRFAFDGHGELSIISAFRRISSAIVVPDTCDSYYTPVRTSGEDSIDALLSVLPGEKRFTRMRLDFSGRTLLQLVGARGSLSFSPTVTETAHWTDLIDLFTSSPAFAHIEELSLCLDKRDYERMASLPPLLACFPKLRGLVVTYPKRLSSCGGHAIDFRDLRRLLMPLLCSWEGEEDGSVACPRLDTLSLGPIMRVTTRYILITWLLLAKYE